MKTNCEYCGAEINTHDEKCPSCGAVNSNYKKTSITQPKTILELKQWYEEKNLPPEETTRFFIGKDIKEPKAFGIYCNPQTGKFVVYKNKADGSRAIRYEGDDQEYAVNEIFQKLRETISVQKAMNVPIPGSSNAPAPKPKKRKSFSSDKISIIVAVVIVVLALLYGCTDKLLHPQRGKYYNYRNNYYYNFNDKYYIFDEDENEWIYYDDDAPFNDDNYERYIMDGDYSSNDIANFEDSSYYQDWYEDHHSNDDDDSDSGWDSGWDSGDSWDSDYGSDWDSDW